MSLLFLYNFLLFNLLGSVNQIPPADSMIYIKGGSFQMGNILGETNERPAHAVTVSGFYFAKYELTVGEFRAFIKDSGYETEAEKIAMQDKSRAKYIWQNDPEGNPAPDQNPVVFVTWNDAVAYCAWLSAKSGITYRLPTEAEWEYAAGNGAQHSIYSWGSNAPFSTTDGNVADETWKDHFNCLNISNLFQGYDDGFATAAPVGTFDPNTFGLYDMTGNVAEWCSDWYMVDYYKNSPLENPSGPDFGTARTIRGGAWNSDHNDCRVTTRTGLSPGIYKSFIGFRVARSE